MLRLNHFVRRFLRAPMFTGVVLLTLAVGIGANTAIFSVVNGVLIKPLAYPDPEALVGVWHVAPGVASLRGDVEFSPTLYFTYREHNKTFQDMGAWSAGGATITGLAEPEQVPALFVTYGTLQALGVQPTVGRLFSQVDDTPGSTETVMLMYDYWQRRLGGSTSVIGQPLTVNSQTRTVIGVMPQGFRFLNVTADVILPQRFERQKLFLGDFSYQGIARLKPGVTLQEANADVARMLPIWLEAWPAPPGIDLQLFRSARFGPKLQPLKQEVVGDIGAVLWVLMGTIGLVLLIACANVANLLLVRAQGRRQELATRAALGASWVRIAREMMSESVMLAVVGGICGIGLAYLGLKLLVAIGPQTLPRLQEISIDPLVLAFTLVISLFSGLLFGIIPVLKYAGPQLAMSLRGGRTMSQGRDRHRARNTLVVVQVALALVLLIGAGLMIRTFLAMRGVQPGFTRPEQVQILRVSIPEAQVREPERVMRAQNDMIDKLAAIPGVISVAFANGAPLEGFNSNDLIYAEDKQYSVGEIPPIRRFKFVSPGYFRTTGTALLAGRDFTWTDLYDKRNVTIVSENFAREMWGGDPSMALGKRLRQSMENPWREVVGVVADVHDDGVHEKAPAIMYWPVMMGSFWRDPVRVTRGGGFLVRTERAATESFLSEARQAIWSINPNLPVFRVRTLKDIYDVSMARTSFTVVMLGIAGAMALLLGLIGIYGVISYAVSQRTREVGIKMALGAQTAGLIRMFVSQGLLLAAVGVGIGLAAATALTRLMQTLLFNTSTMDPVTYVAVALVLLAVAILASYIPARRVTAVNPVEALRTE